MAEFGDPSGPQIESEFEDRPSRRFAKLVGSPAVRKLSSRRLAWAILGSLSLLALLAWAGTRGVRALTHWVAEQPENWIDFAEIRLIPEPPPWVLSKSVGFLEAVRTKAKLPERVPILEVNLEELTKIFSLNPLVERVTKIEVTRRRLSVSLIFRQPVAVVEVAGQAWVVIDQDGTILPTEDIDWVEKKPRPRVRGIADPLPIIFDVPAPTSLAPGLPYKTSNSESLGRDADTEVLKAARLAKYLQGQVKTTPLGRPCPNFERIAPSHKEDGLLLLDTRNNWVYWGSTPGAGPPQGVVASEKWRMLLDRIDREGPLDLKPDQYLRFTPSGLSVDIFRSAKGIQGRSPGSPSR